MWIGAHTVVEAMYKPRHQLGFDGVAGAVQGVWSRHAGGS